MDAARAHGTASQFGPIARVVRRSVLEVAQMLRTKERKAEPKAVLGKPFQQGIPTPSAALARNPPSNARRLHVRALRHEPWRSGFDPELSPSYDLGRRISDAFGRSWDGRLLCWIKADLIAENSWTGRPAVVCLRAGNRFSSPGARVRRRRLAIEIQQLSGKRLCPVLRRNRRTNHFTRR